MPRKSPFRTSPADNPPATPGPLCASGPGNTVEAQLGQLQEKFDVLKAQVRQAPQRGWRGAQAREHPRITDEMTGDRQPLASLLLRTFRER